MDNIKNSSLFRIVLVEPEIPQNTGNIGRTCVATNCELHLVGKMGFEINDTNVKRAGLDYWPHLNWYHHESYEKWWDMVLNSAQNPERVFFLTTKVKQTIYDVSFKHGDWLVFGKETKGLDPKIIQAHQKTAVTIPQFGPVRSLNLATSVAIVAYEGIRQLRHSL